MSNRGEPSIPNRTSASRKGDNRARSSTPELQDISATLNSLLHHIDQKEQRISLELYRLLAQGEPLAVEGLADNLQLPSEEVEGFLNREFGVFRDDRRRIIGFWGLSLSETKHRFEVDGRTLFTWCAWDTLFIPEILQKTARVESTCPVGGETIRLTVSPKGIEQVDPSHAVMSVVLPERAKIEENVVRHFCQYVHFFASSEAASKWVSEKKGTFFVSMDEAFAHARKKNAAQFQDTLFRKESVT